MRLTGLLAFVFALTFSLGCASGLPAVVTSNPQAVSVEYALDSSVAAAGKLAETECRKVGKQAEFVNVDSTATPKSRIANFRCVVPPAPE